jgi:hypothetical protein
MVLLPPATRPLYMHHALFSWYYINIAYLISLLYTIIIFYIYYYRDEILYIISTLHMSIYHICYFYYRCAFQPPPRTPLAGRHAIYRLPFTGRRYATSASLRAKAILAHASPYPYVATSTRTLFIFEMMKGDKEILHSMISTYIIYGSIYLYDTPTIRTPFPIYLYALPPTRTNAPRRPAISPATRWGN